MSFKPIFYDTETTGVRPDRDRIIEIAAFDPLRNESFVQFINPGIPIPPESTAICKITDDMVKDADSFAVVGQKFIDFCGADAVLIAHNNDRFDKPFLEYETKRSGLQLPTWKYLDTLKWSRKYRPDLPSHALQNLREVYGIEANQAHRALDDVMILHKIFTMMTGDLTFEQVMTLIEQPLSMDRMPFGKFQGRPLSEVPKDYIRWLRDSGALEKPENKELSEKLFALNK
jgi:DNA polymerase-3 subunit epsilon